LKTLQIIQFVSNTLQIYISLSHFFGRLCKFDTRGGGASMSSTIQARSTGQHHQAQTSQRSGSPILGGVILKSVRMPPSPQPIPLTESAIRAALRDCYEPEIVLNIVDLGLIESISIAPDPNAPGSGIPGVPARYSVRIALILTTPAEDSPLPAQIQNRLAAFETISRTEVILLARPIWTPERISPEGRERFVAHLASRKAANDLVQIKT
jgi:metal-sulfur cluster biosynthetic enzyme